MRSAIIIYVLPLSTYSYKARNINVFTRKQPKALHQTPN